MLNNIIGAFIISFVNLCVWSKCLAKKIDFKDYKLYIAIVFMTTMLVINFFSVNTILKTVLVVLIVLVTIKFIYSIDLKEALVLSVFNQLIYIISEILVIIAVLIINNIQNNQELVSYFFGTIYANITISLVVFIIIQSPFIKEVYNRLLKITKNEKVYNILVIVFIIVVTASVLFNIIYYKNNLIVLSLICLGLLNFYLFFIIKGIIIKNKYLNMYVKYNDTLKTLKSYEDILDKYKVSNHENKNQLLTIRSMLNNSDNKEIGKFINRLVKEEYKDDERLMMDASKIPSGGLRALIYSKLLYMKNNDLDFMMKVDKKISAIQLIDFDENQILDICRVIGVFLDNAIEEVEKNENGSISIELYILDEQLNISIANTFHDMINLERIDEMQYTTKSKGHGYGLTLVKEIVDKNFKLENVRMINDNVFIQILQINI